MGEKTMEYCETVGRQCEKCQVRANGSYYCQAVADGGVCQYIGGIHYMYCARKAACGRANQYGDEHADIFEDGWRSAIRWARDTVDIPQTEYEG